jgi:hypothetical protein
MTINGPGMEAMSGCNWAAGPACHSPGREGGLKEGTALCDLEPGEREISTAVTRPEPESARDAKRGSGSLKGREKYGRTLSGGHVRIGWDCRALIESSSILSSIL